MHVEEEAQKYVTGKIVPESDSKEDEIKAALADEIGCGEITLRDILDRLR